MNYISLGYFCSVAIDLEELGLRAESSPFDWLISDFEGVIAAMKSHFADFLNCDYLSQSKAYPAYYRNVLYNIDFYHDFDAYTPLDKQLPCVQEKYNRRVTRFYNSITKPTCFIRYISDEETLGDKSKELIYIENNYEQILAFLKSFNKENTIIFIANEGVISSKLKIYNVQKDDNDSVARHPIYKNPMLLDMLSCAEAPNKQENLSRYKKKTQYTVCRRLRKIITSRYKKIFYKEYSHCIQH